MDERPRTSDQPTMPNDPMAMPASNGWYPGIEARALPAEETMAEAKLAHTLDDQPTLPASPWRDRLSTVGPVSLGGFLGANARYLVGQWMTNRSANDFPWATLLINVTGSFVLGFYLTLVTERFTGRPTTRLFVATGFLGAYTTFSTFGYEAARLIQGGDLLQALAYVAASLILGLVGVVAGVATAHAL